MKIFHLLILQKSSLGKYSRCEMSLGDSIGRVPDPQTYAIIGAALEVHRLLGCGFLEPVYHEALALEFTLLNYLKATGYQRGLLLNFGAASLERKRFVRNWSPT